MIHKLLQCLHLVDAKKNRERSAHKRPENDKIHSRSVERGYKNPSDVWSLMNYMRRAIFRHSIICTRPTWIKHWYLKIDCATRYIIFNHLPKIIYIVYLTQWILIGLNNQLKIHSEVINSKQQSFFASDNYH